MFFRQFHLEALGHASYLVGDTFTGQALVVDPRRDVGGYFESARAQGLRITHAVDTHGHNDYLSGLSELAARSNVQLLGSAEAQLGYEHRPIKDGEVLDLGDVGVEVLHTPGHTPEHISLLLHDREAGDEAALLLSGGALLVGDLARPDLLGGEDEARAAARAFCKTLQAKILTLPDHVEVWPTHVAGSLCGANIGSRLSTTVGYERRTNPVLAELDRAGEPVTDCLRLENLPAVPPYWRRMRAQNMTGVAALGVLPEPPALLPDAFERAVSAPGAVVVDTRQAEAFGGGHIPGALNVGLGSSFPTWVGTALPEDARALLVLDDPSDLVAATWHLLRIGYPPPAGWLAGGMYAWRTAAKSLERVEQITVHELRDRLGDLRVLDVRQPAEWAAGHIEGATFITGAELPGRLDEVPAGSVAVVCGSGFRSSVSISLLHASGRDDVVNVLGGMSAWNAADLPTTDGV
ncbi:MAG: MBL fold metallo-hydrolase [Nitriliruptorales bacterium]|nr:MBL fold metallo-hydrolase [Nitriliruptorales bacterium]